MITHILTLYELAATVSLGIKATNVWGKKKALLLSIPQSMFYITHKSKTLVYI